MNLPNFLIIGAAKSGTTSLYSYLNQHPDIYFSAVKEPRFFALEGQEVNYQGPSQVINQKNKTINTLPEYSQLFAGVTTETAIGEASTLYLYSPEAPQKIKQHIPEAKLIVILRNPIDRAYSGYAHLVRDGYENLSFAEALERESERIAENWSPHWHHQQRGFYYQQLKRYFEIFAPEQIKICLYDDFIKQPQQILEDLFVFLGVDSQFKSDFSQKMNVSGVPKNAALHQIITKDNPLKSLIKQLFPQDLRKIIYKRIKKSNLRQQSKMSPEDRQKLSDLYRDDITKLEQLINRDLSSWLDYSPIK